MKKNQNKISEIIELLKLKVKSCEKNLPHIRIEGGYVSDLLSDVMANSKKGDIWITNQVHPNIVAVAVLKEIACIIIVRNREPESETIKKAESEKIVIFSSEMSAFELAGKLYGLGIPGMR